MSTHRPRCVLLALKEEERISHPITDKPRGDSQNHHQTLLPMTASQFARLLPNHQIFPSMPIRPHSASHCFLVRRLALEKLSGSNSGGRVRVLTQSHTKDAVSLTSSPLFLSSLWHRTFQQYSGSCKSCVYATQLMPS